MIRHLIDQRRGPKYPLILNDSIAYGFWRNLLGMKGVAIALARAAQAMTADASFWAAARYTPATQVTAIALLIIWIAFLLIIVRPPRVWDAGVAYAVRLLASLPPPSVPQPKGRAPEGRNPKRTVNRWPSAHIPVEPMMKAFSLRHAVGL